MLPSAIVVQSSFDPQVRLVWWPREAHAYWLPADGTPLATFREPITSGLGRAIRRADWCNTNRPQQASPDLWAYCPDGRRVGVIVDHSTSWGQQVDIELLLPVEDQQ